ncbi:MAG: type I-U CRISPR-associated protein Csx17, partial [Candidatus Dadabacteria bacterium]|nr:type I-U CRISPR-associated protein Csx17 [Candidatus Dadabacteria bacterium]
DYVPSPIIAPWNGGSCFFPSKKNTAFDALSKTNDISKRFLPLQEVIQIAERAIRNRGLSARPEGEQKAELISALRAEYPEYALGWLDAVLAFHSGRISFPPLLGTGGNDGNFDFTNNFMQRLVSEETGLFEVKSGKPLPNTERLLRTSLFGDTSQGLSKVAVGQFSPGYSGGPNATSEGFEGDSSVNPWDFIFTLEGAIMFAGAATRRHQSTTDPGASFPFMVSTVGAGHGSVSGADEAKSRAEFWAPLWKHPASCEEVTVLLKEGRAVLRGKNARNGLDFARAVASLGINRGVEHFERYGFLERSGKAYLSVSLGKRKVLHEVPDSTRLIEDLDVGRWLERVRRFARRTDSSSARNSIRKLEDSLFEMTATGYGTPRSLQNTLVAIGDFVLWLARVEGSLDEKPPPPPRLSSEWIHKANDGTCEYRIARALASIGWQSSHEEEPASGVETAISRQTSGAETGDPRTANGHGEEIPMAAHFVPVVSASVMRRYREWDVQSNKKLCVLESTDIVSGLVSVLQRRLIEQNTRDLQDKPLYGTIKVNWMDISAFLSPNFDYARCKRILSGLVWVRPAIFLESASESSSQPLPPFPYAALKPVFTPDTTLEEASILPPSGKIPVPSGIVAQLRSDKVDEAVRMAFARVRASGIDSHFSGRPPSAGTYSFTAAISGKLLAASMVIPLREQDLKYIVGRAYRIEKEAQNT